ncbi:carbohydrate ABC transporter membrane protein 1 (CUT1 family) [Lachnotalea glycerini]|uniref:Carbohydrate ABC transporter membrane protein 1 (CUT1 family) n=1 Tax=Lachnotalea glycerini TaxID=1763509 RepID=A0A255IAK8_9FIRM|nr:ABC transporter permease subunit [Lachnotalea glycerini]PXV96172.1 carbohydrate ABC transporter membrane protein 1 (CUT1 family) [Lachnotalea glycerini]RDY30350.1 sugar ABC transporter permease [Lachnotalea glycerini]
MNKVSAKVQEPVTSKGELVKYFKQHKWLYFMLIPGVLYFITFRYIPMGGIIIAFQQYSPFTGIAQSKWVGLTHFKNFFIGTDFWMLLKNTLGISILSIIFYFPAPIFLSLLLNEIKHQKYKKLVQTFIYIPHFISWVIVASLTYTLLNINDGIINQLIKAVFGHTVNFLGLPQYFRGLIVGQSIWKETGYGTIIFLAALSGVDTQLYEAARVDGAGRWRLMWHITLPAIKGTIIIMLILKVGSILNTGYEQIFLMRNSLNISTAEVFDTYIYQKGITNAQYSYSTASGLFKSVVGMIMVLGANWIAKKSGESGIY